MSRLSRTTRLTLLALVLLGVAAWAVVLIQRQPNANAAATTQPSATAPAGLAWPVFRGDAGLTGVARAQLPGGLARRWTFKTQGPIKSSPVIADGTVFVGSDDGYVYALALSDGQPRWRFAVGKPVQAPPLYHQGVVYVGGDDQALHALDARTGRQRWQAKTDDRIAGSANLFTTPDGALRVLVGSYDNKLHCVDAATGQTIWTYESGSYVNGTPAIAGDQAVFGGCDGSLHVVALADGRKVAEIELGAPIAASAAVHGRWAYVGSYGNEFFGVDLDQAAVAWTYKDRDFPYFSSPAVTPDAPDTPKLVVFGGRDKRLHAADPATGQRRWTFQARGKVDSSPVIVGDHVVVGADDGRLYLLHRNDGRLLWSFDVGAPITGSPAVGQGLVVVGADDGGIHAFGAP